MVAEAQNATVTILRGTTTNPFGDKIDSNQPLISGVPAVLVETSRTIQDPSTPTPRTIRLIECHVPASIGVLNTDRVRDEATGDTFMILGVTLPPTLDGAPPDYLLQMKRVTATGV